MRRNIDKIIESYKELTRNTDSQAAAFYASDFQALADMSAAATRSDTNWNLISNSLMAGFMIGYRYGKAQK